MSLGSSSKLGNLPRPNREVRGNPAAYIGESHDRPPHRRRPGGYTVPVKVIDMFGNDTMTLVPVNVG
jgi:hypothetical protein